MAETLNREQQARMFDLTYNNHEIFSPYETLGCFGWLYHTIPTTTDKPVYLPP